MYWGSTTGSYNSSLRTIVPAVTSFGAVLDFEAEDVDGDRDHVLNRTRDDDDGPGSGFYEGRRTQLV